jgi:hypothetical protein
MEDDEDEEWDDEDTDPREKTICVLEEVWIHY